MKKISLYILMLVILASSLIGCKKNTPNDDNADYQVFEADVIGTEGGVLISPNEDSNEYRSSDRITLATSEAEIIDDKGKVSDIDILKSGDRIRVYYDGLIAESYPAQIRADKIELIGRNNVIDGIFAMIDDVYQEDSALNSNITMIAFDTTEWTVVSEIEREVLLAMAKEEYELEVVVGAFDELAEQGLIDKENLYFENGILIEIGDIEINNAKDKIKASIRKWRSGTGAIGWNAEAGLNKGIWEITRTNKWIS